MDFSALSSSSRPTGGCCGGGGGGGIRGRVALRALSLALIGYITWKEVSSTGASSVASGALFPVWASQGDTSRAHASTHGATPLYSIEVVNEYHHDPGAYTQGLLYARNNMLFESTGLYGQSSVREVHLQTGKMEPYRLRHDTYGEGEMQDAVMRLSLGYFLNPRYQYSDNVHNDPEVRACTLDVIRRLARTVDDRIEAEREVQAISHMDSNFFGEGLALLGERLFQVTWLTRTGFIYDRYNLTRLGKFTHQMQDGWGLATDEKVIFGSDGTSSLYQLEPQNLTVIKRATVKYAGHAVSYLNELEYVGGEIWANVLQSDCIARISAETGEVIGWILLHKLRKQLMESGYEVDVLNGIAWDKENERIFVTGKLWPKLYEIKLQELRSPPSDGTIEEICQLILH